MARPSLSRDAIVDAAVALADDGGMGAVTMRAVAGKLGVEAMSLYHHVGDKRGLLEAAAERVWAQVDTTSRDSPMDASDWADDVRHIASCAYETLLAHAWALDVASSAGGEPRMRVIEAILDALTRAGLSSDDVYEGYHLIDAVILGYVAQQASYRGETGSGAGASAGAGAIPAGLDRVLEHAAAHQLERGPQSGFRIGLDLVLDSLARRVPAA